MPLGAGSARQLMSNFEHATVIFDPAPGDIRVAESDGGPVIVARPGKPKLVVLGFHPARTALRYELATPLLFANMVRWMAPDVFRRWDTAGGSTGTVEMAVDPDTRTDNVHVSGPDGSAVAFTLKHDSLRFFRGSPGTVKVDTGEREMVYSLVLPELGEMLWQPPANVPRDLTGVRRRTPGSSQAWPWLAALGALGLLIEWILYGRYRRTADLGPAPQRRRIRNWRSWVKQAGALR